ncbi:uncharacterized protein LOC110055858 isoform X6 [Orbicella faveolata]|uniref:uncharacterized protein LOC110055858 isoform X6 n=1 Tax=Orbicella faveolata TaxID=48498 RepID=UPI0009E1B8EF|nr:uncharacterized protein LOC110055858 isoform X6 [Orbicella faveolata]
MEHAGSVESDASSCEEPNAKRCRRDPNAPKPTKSVVVFLDSDVTVTENGQVLMPNTIEMAALKKNRDGKQYSKMAFTSEMNKEDVLSALYLNFPILRTKRRLSCASALDKYRTKLDFHGDRRIWNGALIKKCIRGNSALYVLAEGSLESRRVSDHEVSQVASIGSSLAATQRLQELSHISSTAGQRHLTGKGDASHALLLNANHQGQIELPQRGKEELTSAAAHSTGGFLQEGAQKRQYYPWMIEQTTLYPAAQENVPTSEQGNSVQQTPPPPPPPPPAHKNVPVQVLNKDASSNERKRKSSPHQHQENSALELLFAISEGETSDSAIESMWEESTDSDHVTGQSGGILKEICPNKGSIKGGDRFHLILEDFVPVETELCKAIFQGCGEVYLHKGSLSTLAGETPASLQGPGKVKVTLMSSDESCWYGETEFLYTEDPPTEEEFLSKVVKDRNMWQKLFDRISSSKPSDGQASDSSGKTGPRSSSSNQSKCAWSVKQLQLLVYKAAEIDGLEFIQMIFSTSAGKVVFNSYRNSATLPEDVARANGHLALANYLQDVNSRLSKESNSHAGMEGIDWLELKHAVDGDQSLTSGTDDAQILKKCQPVGYLESDDDESDYFADDEMSPCSSPSHNNVCDSENEDHSQTFMKTANCEADIPFFAKHRFKDNHQIVAILGTPGMGKSAICVRLLMQHWEKAGHSKVDEDITEAGDRKEEDAGTGFQLFAKHLKKERASLMPIYLTSKKLELLETSIATPFEIRHGRRDAVDYKGTAFQLSDEFQRAIDYFTKALAIRIELCARQVEAAYYGEHDKAKEYLEKGPIITSERGDRQGEASCYENLGTELLFCGEHDKAKKYLEKALAITSECGDRQGLASCYRNLGTVYQSLGEHDKAKEYLEKVLAITSEGGDRQGEASCYQNLGTVFLSCGEYDKVKEYLEKALAITSEGGDRQGPQRRPVREQAAAAMTTSTHAPCQESSRDDINYKAKSGYVLVINNYIFPWRDDVERTGSNDDVRNLTSLFNNFNFRHVVEDNQTGSQMIKLLQTTAEKDFSRYDCFVCAILSHGKKDGIYGTDEELIKIEAITSLFRRNECPSLEGKPKIFLFQACHGSRRDTVPVESDSDPIPLTSSSLPADADFLICFASAPDHESYRQAHLGSWFISSVVDVFKEYAEREHLMDMMLRVNNRVAGFYSKEGLKQIPCQVCMLRKRVFFDPKYS